jgi:hypothetical protein
MFLSYANYVSATIHVRLAAQKEPGSYAHKALRKCSDVLEVEQSVGWSSRRAKQDIYGVITRMGVHLGNREALGETSDLTSSDLDIEAIMKTFAPQQLLTGSLVEPSPNTLCPSEIEADPSSSYALQPSDLIAKGDVLFSQRVMPFAGNDVWIWWICLRRS